MNHQLDRSYIDYVLTALFTIVILFGSIKLLGEFNRPKKDLPLPIITETSNKIIIRMYGNTPSGDYFILSAANGASCLITEEAWLQTIIGQEYICLWKDGKKN
jgi:hypothetical protein